MTTTTDVVAGAMRKAMLRVGPFLGPLYLIAYIDRNNAGFAKLEMTTGLGITDRRSGSLPASSSSATSSSRCPSNLMLQRFGARKWIARIMVRWGNQNVMHTSTPGSHPRGAAGLRHLQVAAQDAQAGGLVAAVGVHDIGVVEHGQAGHGRAQRRGEVSHRPAPAGRGRRGG